MVTLTYSFQGNQPTKTKNQPFTIPSPNQKVEFDQTCIDTLLEVGNVLITFWLLWPQQHLEISNVHQNSFPGHNLLNRMLVSVQTVYLYILSL